MPRIPMPRISMPTPASVDDQKAPFGPPLAKHVEVATARLVTFDADSPFWTHSNAEETYGGLVKGSIVRLRPPVDCPLADVARARDWVERYAVAVRVLPTRRSAVVTQQRVRHIQRVGARDVAGEIVAASSYPDHAALLARVERRLGEVGL
jgi:hypothetical protein